MLACEIAKATGGELFGNGEVMADGITTDSRSVSEGALFIAIRGERFDGNRFIASAYAQGAAVVIGNEDISQPEGKAYIKVSDSVKALGLLSTYYRQKFSIPLVGVTGSVGKTTTKEMIAAVLSASFQTLKTEGNFNNAIGMPLTLLGLSETTEAAVIEMGMSAKGEISYLTRLAKPTVAVITNIGLCHIEHLKTQENIRDAKLEIAEGLPKGGTLFVCGDDPFLKDIQIEGIQVLRFGLDNPACEIYGKVLSENSFSVDGFVFDVPIPGKHNILNALCAYAVGKAHHMKNEKIREGLLSYKTDGIRQSETEIRPGISVISDYYNASPTAMDVALHMLGKGDAKRKIAVLGDMLELGEMSEACHRSVGEKAAKEGIHVLLTVGKEMTFAAEEGRKNGIELVRHFQDNEALGTFLSENLRTGDRVLIKGSHGMKMGEIFDKIK